MKEDYYKTMGGITESFWCRENCYVRANSLLESGIQKLHMHMQQDIEDMKGSAKNANDTSNEHQQAVNVLWSVRSEKNAVKNTCNEVQEPLATREKKKASVEQKIKNLNKK